MECRQPGKALGTQCTAQQSGFATGLLALLLSPGLHALHELCATQCSSALWGESAKFTLQPTLAGPAINRLGLFSALICPALGELLSQPYFKKPRCKFSH